MLKSIKEKLELVIDENWDCGAETSTSYVLINGDTYNVDIINDEYYSILIEDVDGNLVASYSSDVDSENTVYDDFAAYVLEKYGEHPNIK